MSVTAGVWSCPTCPATVHGPIEVTTRAQLQHGKLHGTHRDHMARAATEAQDAQDAAEEIATRRREAHARKGKTQTRTRGSRSAR